MEPYEPSGALRISMQPYGAQVNQIEANGTLRSQRNPMEPYGVPWIPNRTLLNFMKPYGALWSPMEPYGSLQNPIKPQGTLWSPTVLYGALQQGWGKRGGG